MTPTPTQIATQASEAIKEVANDVLRRHADADPSNQSILIGDAILPEFAALILSAAAKMVQQSGAIPAFERCLEIASDACTSEERPYIEEYEKALDRLRSITGEAGK